MRTGLFIGVALAAAFLPTLALADDPRDPSMRDAAARARDRVLTRELNVAELQRVRARDARGETGWHVARADADLYAARMQDYERAMADYRRNRADYDRNAARWRSATAACNDGDDEACD